MFTERFLVRRACRRGNARGAVYRGVFRISQIKPSDAQDDRAYRYAFVVRAARCVFYGKRRNIRTDFVVGDNACRGLRADDRAERRRRQGTSVSSDRRRKDIAYRRRRNAFAVVIHDKNKEFQPALSVFRVLSDAFDVCVSRRSGRARYGAFGCSRGKPSRGFFGRFRRDNDYCRRCRRVQKSARGGVRVRTDRRVHFLAFLSRHVFGIRLRQRDLDIRRRVFIRACPKKIQNYVVVVGNKLHGGRKIRRQQKPSGNVDTAVFACRCF